MAVFGKAGAQHFDLRLIEVDKSGAIVENRGFDTVDLQELLGRSNDFGRKLLQGGTVVAVVEVQFEKTAVDGGCVVMLIKAESALADILDSRILVRAAGDADQKKGRQLSSGKMPVFYADGKWEQKDQLLSAIGAGITSGCRQVGNPGHWGPGNQPFSTAGGTFFAKNHHRFFSSLR